jgi:hypothetical protein
LILYSEQFDNASWSKVNTTITANSTTSPDGTNNADTLIDNSTNSIHACYNSGGGLGTYTFSFYAKANTLTRVGLLTAVAVNTTLASTAQVFDLSNGTVVNTISGVTASITNVGNGWYRCSTTLSALTSGSYYITCVNTGTNVGYIGSGSSLYIYGAQLEAGAYPTTYIPTTTAQATRVADSFSRNNIFTNGLITSSGGTWFVELLNNVALTRDASGSELYIGEDATSGLAATKKAILIRNNGGASSVLLSVTFWNGTSLNTLYTTTTSTVKLAIKFDGTTADIFANGTKVVASASVALTLANMQHLNALSGVPRFISQMDLFPTPLTDAECIALTTI